MKILKESEMQDIEGGMPCAVAIGFLVASIALTCTEAATGVGAFAASFVFGYGGALWSTVDSCG